MASQTNGAAPSYSSAPADTMTNAPAKKWVPYGGGYDPKSRGPPSSAQSFSSAPADALSNAPAKKWQPYGGGYDPKSRGAPAPAASQASSMYAPPTAAADSYSSAPADTMTNAPAGKWQGAYGGYDPKSRGAPAPMASQTSAMYAPADPTAPSYSSAPADTMTNAPAKKWAPYGGGYDPKSRGPPSSQSFSSQSYASAPTDSLSNAPAGKKFQPCKLLPLPCLSPILFVKDLSGAF